MTILFPIGSFYPAQLGGPANTIYWMSRALHEKGHQVIVATTDYGLKNSDVITNQWLANECGKVFYQKTTFNYFPVRLIRRIMPILKKVDVVHLTSLFYPLSWMLVGWIVLTGKKTPIIWSVRGELADIALSFSSFQKKIVVFLIRKLFRRRIVFHATSDDETETLYRKLGKDIQIIQLPNYILLSEKLNRLTRKTILYLGRIHPIKGLENLIDAFSRIRNNEDFTLLIAGNDQNDYADKLKMRCAQLGMESKVFFAGHVEGDEKEKLLNEAYLMVLPSHTENFGNVVIEALAQGTPVIASTNTPWQILDTVKNGSWVSNEPSSLQKAIEMMINCDDKEYLEIRKKAFALCRSHFSIRENINRWEENYSKMALIKNETVYL